MTIALLYVMVGLAAGIFSGLVGVGGGVLIVPALVFLFGMNQHQAQGTTLSLLLPPIGLLAAWTYWKHGYVDWRAAAFMCVGFFIGGFFGARLACALSNPLLSKVFGFVMLLISVKMILGK